MPSSLRRSLLCRFAAFGLVFAVSVASAANPSTVAGVAVLRATEWSPDDPGRDGAGEFEVWLRVAQLQRAHLATGLVAIGDRKGVFRSGGERALELHGAPPSAADMENPTRAEVAAIRAHVRKFQAIFAAESGLVLAAR